MKRLKIGMLLGFMVALSACGNQLVEFGDAGVIVDAGPGIVDAGPGIVDAGPVDAGSEVDAGPADAGPEVDAGPADAGPVDAGPVEVDAGPGTVDAGPTDGGQNNAPTVIATTPVNNATNVGLSPAITATFSEAMNATTINVLTFKLQEGTSDVAGTVTLDSSTNTATFTPTVPLDDSATYTATITTGAQDLSGLGLAADYVWTFSTLVGPPRVIAVSPSGNATNVNVNVSASATFNKAMNASTINTTTFTVKQGSTPVVGVVTYNSAFNTATFAPALPLLLNTTYTATITTGAQDTGGLSLAANYVWSFTTNPSRPTVVSTTPANLATGVSINERPTVTFSEPMNPVTINVNTFTLMQGTTAVTGSITLDTANNTATFTPFVPLLLNTLYTATVTTGAEDTGGLGLAANYVWTFTTAACSQAPVDLRTASTFAALAGTTLTSAGTSSVAGDLGVSPGTDLTGFPPGTFTGALHMGDSVAAQAEADVSTAFTDAAGRTTCVNTVSGDIGSQTFTPGLYQSTSSLSIVGGDLTLDAQNDPDSIFVFQVGSSLSTTTGRKVILVNGAKAGNIFWQVGSSATFAAMTDFSGTILADQSITLGNGSTLNGRALAHSAAVTMDTNTVVVPGP